MGQTVGGYTRSRRRDSFSSCVSNFDSATSIESKKANTTSSTEDDVTPQSLFPYTTSANSPLNSDERSMSSSIIETSSEEKGTQHVAGNQRLASKIIPKRAWSGYHLFQLTNMRGERIHSSPRVIRSPKIRPKLNTMDSPNTNTGEEDIDQLITMMKNHKVSDDSPFDFNFNNKPLTPQPSPQPIPATTTTTTFTPSSEFKFSFSANIPPTTATSNTPGTAFTANNTTNEPNYIKVREIYREVDREEDEDEEEEEEEEQEEQEEPKPEQDQKRYDPHLNHRKILPLPKPRLKKCSNIPTTTVINNNHTTTTTTTTLTETTIPDTTNLDNNKSINNLDDQKPDNNKRKERNWKDNFTSHSMIPIPAAELNKTGIKKAEKAPTVPVAPVAVVVVEKKAARKKKGKGLVEDSSTKQKKKTKTKSRQKNKEDIAPGGFLSSDINLFQNPIPDDWICLFCQYDILFSGLTEARKKNGYYRRKKERSRRAREAELRRMGSLCYSDVEHDT